jgi:ABC-2 type transport system permease protein
MTAFTIPAPGRTARATRFLTALGNEVGKGLRFAWAEKLQIFLEMPFFIIMVLLLGPLLGAGHQIAAGHLAWALNSQRVSVLTVAFIPFFLFYMQSVKLFWRLLGEIQTGTIEQVYLSPLPSWLVAAAGRVVAALIETLLLAGILYGVISGFVTLHFHWTFAALLPAVSLIISGTGYSLVIGGMTLLWKRIQLLQEGVLMLVMVFAFAALPVFTVPGWFAGIGRVLPLTSPVTSLYGVTLGHRGVTGLWGTGGLVELLVTAAAYLLAGILTFRVLERITRKRGTLGAY